ncbi:hypothetical protein [Prevotella sp. E13-27]|nr:hypothetical protein [Prevotella sp. E13-27]
MTTFKRAKVAGCDAIITGNKRHFTEFCDMPLMTANEFLTELVPL